MITLIGEEIHSSLAKGTIRRTANFECHMTGSVMLTVIVLRTSYYTVADS